MKNTKFYKWLTRTPEELFEQTLEKRNFDEEIYRLKDLRKSIRIVLVCSIMMIILNFKSSSPLTLDPGSIIFILSLLQLSQNESEMKVVILAKKILSQKENT